MPATIRDVAKECGCSITTVSYVLNDGPRGVHPETRTRILDAMQRLRYHPSATARGLNRKAVDAIGVVFPNPEASLVVNPFFGGVLDGIIKEAATARQNVTLYSGMEWRNANESLPAFRARRVDGLLLLAPRTNSDLVATLAGENIPLVVVGDAPRDEAIACVDTNNYAAAFGAVSHLLALNHQRVGFLGGQPAAPSARQRRKGYEDALCAAGVPLDLSLCLLECYEAAWDEAGQSGQLGFFDELWGYQGMCALLTLPQPPTAVFAANDMIASGAFRACREKGVSIPSQMSIVGFDDTSLALHLTPPLTTVRQPMAQLGATATRLLLDIVRQHHKAENTPPRPHRIVLPTELIVRGSTTVAPFPHIS